MRSEHLYFAMFNTPFYKEVVNDAAGKTLGYSPLEPLPPASVKRELPSTLGVVEYALVAVIPIKRNTWCASNVDYI